MANNTLAGYWDRIASAVERFAGVTGTANDSIAGSMLRTAEAFEGLPEGGAGGGGGGGGGGSFAWGGITGTLSDQTDLQTALDGKLTVIDWPGSPGYKLTTGLNGLGSWDGTATGAQVWIDASDPNAGYVGGGTADYGRTWTFGTWDVATSRFFIDSSHAFQFALTPYVGTNAIVHTGTANELIDDRVAALLVAGTNITLAYNDTAGTLTINAASGGGAIADGDKGDITVSGSGSIWSIDAGAVTLAKMASVATGTVFYRKTAGTGAPEVQTLATLKTDLGLGTAATRNMSVGTTAPASPAINDLWVDLT